MTENWTPLKSWGLNSSLAANKQFLPALPGHVIADQVANLLNSNNNLTVIHNANSIISSNVQYFIELQCNSVVGCVGLLNEHTMDKILHLSVVNTMRNMGIGIKLLKFAINYSKKDTIYMHIREDNVGSKSLAYKVGFNAIAYIPKLNYNILTFCLFRRNNVSRI